MDESRIKDVGTLLAAFFEEEKLRRGGRYAQFFESWRAVVGDRLAAHSRVVDLDKGILMVEAEHPGWIQMLQLRQTKTLEALAGRFPDLGLRGIAFRLAGSGAATAKASTADARDAAMKDGEIEEDDDTVLEDIHAPESGPKDPEFTAAIESLKRAIREGKKR